MRDTSHQVEEGKNEGRKSEMIMAYELIRQIIPIMYTHTHMDAWSCGEAEVKSYWGSQQAKGDVRVFTKDCHELVPRPDGWVYLSVHIYV